MVVFVFRILVWKYVPLVVHERLYVKEITFDVSWTTSGTYFYSMLSESVFRVSDKAADSRASGPVITLLWLWHGNENTLYMRETTVEQTIHSSSVILGLSGIRCCVLNNTHENTQ